MLAAAYPAGALVGAIPSGVVAARAGVKPTVLVGLTTVGDLHRRVRVRRQRMAARPRAVRPGLASAFSWTGALAWLVAGSPAGRRGRLIGSAFATAVAGALFGPVLGGVASIAGVGWTFGMVGVASLGLVAWAAATPAARPGRRRGCGCSAAHSRGRQMIGAFWFVVLPALLFGTLSVLAPLRLSTLGFGAVAIGAVFLCSAAFEAVNNIWLGRVSDRYGTRKPLIGGLVGSIAVASVLPWPDRRFVLAALIVCGGIAFGTFFTPGMTLLTHLSEARGLDYGYTFALINLAWAPGQAIGAAGGGALAHATADSVPYLLLAGLCALTLAALWRSGGSTGWTTGSARASSGSSSRTTGGG